MVSSCRILPYRRCADSLLRRPCPLCTESPPILQRRCGQRFENIRKAYKEKDLECADYSHADIYGNRSNVIKSKVYNTLVHRAGNTLTLRNKAEHARRRRVMSPGFSDASLRLLEPKILAQINQMIQGLLNETGSKEAGPQHEWSEARDMATWCTYSTVRKVLLEKIDSAVRRSPWFRPYVDTDL